MASGKVSAYCTKDIKASGDNAEIYPIQEHCAIIRGSFTGNGETTKTVSSRSLAGVVSIRDSGNGNMFFGYFGGDGRLNAYYGTGSYTFTQDVIYDFSGVVYLV